MIFVQQIYDFNQQAGLISRGYSDYLESSFQIEEALEGFNLTELFSTLEDFSPDVTNVAVSSPEVAEALSAKLISRMITSKAMQLSEHSSPADLRKSILSDVERLDKAIDAIVFAFGSIFKLGLTLEQASRAISVVCETNLQKLSMPKDEHGKLTKPADFVGPEVALQSILDERQP